MAEVFVSYAKADRNLAQQLAANLEAKGWTTWWDTGVDAPRGTREAFERELESAQKIIVLWSRASIASPFVLHEAIAARDGGKLERFLLDVNRNCHGGFPRSRKSDSSAPSTPTEGSHGEGVLERLAGACGCDGRGGREPAGGRASAQPCTLHSGALARSVV